MTIQGVMNPTIIGQPAGNPRLSAIATRDAANEFQNNANKAMSGGKYMTGRKYMTNRKYKRRGGGASSGIPVAQFNLPYKEQNGPGTGINAQVSDLNQTNTQSLANSNYDKLAAVKKGGFRIHKYNKKTSHRKRSGTSSMAGGNPNWSWGCYSGGKKKTQRKYRKSRKHYRKSRKQ